MGRLPKAIALSVSLALGGLSAGQDGRVDRLLAEADRLASVQTRRADLAVPLYREAAALAEQSGQTENTARAWASLGSALWSVHEVGPAVEALERARDLARKGRFPRIEAQVLRRLANILVEAGRYDEGDRALLDALELARRSNDAQLIVGALNSLSVSARRSGRLREAHDYAAQGLRELDAAVAEGKTFDAALLFALPFNLGKSLADAGDYGAAIVYFDRAFASARETANIAGEWHALHDTAEWYEAQGDLERAERYYERALAQSRLMESRDPEAHTLRGLGSIAEASGDYARAIDRYTSAWTIFDRIAFTAEIPETLSALARAHFLAGRGDEAAAILQQALRLAIAYRQPISVARARLELANQHQRAGRTEQASKEYGETLAIARANAIRPLEPQALAGLAALARRGGDLEGAVDLYRQSAAAIEIIRGYIVSIDERAAYADAVHGTYSGLLDTLLDLERTTGAQGAARAALVALERERTWNLQEALRDSGVDRSRELPETARNRQRELQRVVVQLQTQLIGRLEAGRRAELRAKLDDAERALNAVEGRTRVDASAADRGGSLGWTVPESLETLERSIGSDEALIEYVTDREAPLAFVITPGAFHVVRLPAVVALDARVEFFTGLLAGPDPRDAIVPGLALTNALVAPVVDKLPSQVTRLVIAASGAVAGLPFAALPVPQAGNGGTEGASPLVARYEIAYVPSLVALDHLRRMQRAPAPRDLVAVGNPRPPGQQAQALFASGRRGLELGALPYSAREVETVARYVSGPVDLLLGEKASELSVKGLDLGDFKILHFATHAVVDARVASRSAIVLGSERGHEDGLLQPREIYQLNLRADLVVLSACATAAGRQSSAEGVQSLARAFTYAGARAVVGTLWDVEDRTAGELVERFYSELSRGRKAATALRRAQLASLGPRPYETAANWAAFVIQGDPSALPQIQARLSTRLRQHAWPLSVGGLAIIVLLASLTHRRWSPRRTPNDGPAVVVQQP